VIPTRTTGGAGSIRCGTSWHPDTEVEIADVCPAIGRRRLEQTATATAVFALVAATLIPFHAWIEERGTLRILVTVVMVVFWLLGGALSLYELSGTISRTGT
jgi:hypothetical protein